MLPVCPEEAPCSLPEAQAFVPNKKGAAACILQTATPLGRLQDGIKPSRLFFRFRLILYSNSCLKQAVIVLSELQGRDRHMLFEKINKAGHILKSGSYSNFTYRKIGINKQFFGFFYSVHT